MGSSQSRHNLIRVIKYPFKDTEKNTKISKNCHDITKLEQYEVANLMNEKLEEIKNTPSLDVAKAVLSHPYGLGLHDYTTNGLIYGNDASIFIEFLLSMNHVKVYRNKLLELISSSEFKNSEKFVNCDNQKLSKTEIQAAYQYFEYLFKIFNETCRVASPTYL